jgi:hypothetical protein
LDDVKEGQFHIRAMHDGYDDDEVTSVWEIFINFLYLQNDIETRGRDTHTVWIMDVGVYGWNSDGFAHSYLVPLLDFMSPNHNRGVQWVS